MMRAWGRPFAVCSALVWTVWLAVSAAACGGASSQPLTPDPDPTPTDQDIAALQNAQTSIAAGTIDAGAAPPPAPNAADPKNKSHKP